MSKLYNEFQKISSDSQKESHRIFKDFLINPNLSYKVLCDLFLNETGLTANRQNIALLMEELGYPKRDKAVIKQSKINNGKQGIYNKEKEHIKLIERVGENNLIEEYNTSSLQKMAIKYDTTSYVVKNALIYLNIELRELPKTFKEIINILESKGYDRDKIEKIYLDGRSFKNFKDELSTVAGYNISSTSVNRLLKFLNIKKNDELVKEQQGAVSRKQLDAKIELLKSAGFESPQDVAKFYNENPGYTIQKLVNMINAKIKDPVFTPRWIRRHVQPFIEHRSKTNPGVSREENEFCNWLKTILPNSEEIVRNTYTIIPPREIDIYIPSLNIAIEFNGLPWHGEEYMMKSRGISAYSFHKDKYDKCLEKNIHLLYVWSDDWALNKEEMKTMIKEKIANPDKKIPQLQKFMSNKDINSQAKNANNLKTIDRKIKKLYNELGTINAVAIACESSRAYIRQSLNRSGINTEQFTYKTVVKELEEANVSVEDLQNVYKNSTKREFIDFVSNSISSNKSIGFDLINHVIKFYKLTK